MGDEESCRSMTAAIALRAAEHQGLLDRLSERSHRVLEWHLRAGLTLEEIGIRENVSIAGGDFLENL